MVKAMVMVMVGAVVVVTVRGEADAVVPPRSKSPSRTCARRVSPSTARTSVQVMSRIRALLDARDGEDQGVAECE